MKEHERELAVVTTAGKWKSKNVREEQDLPIQKKHSQRIVGGNLVTCSTLNIIRIYPKYLHHSPHRLKKKNEDEKFKTFL